MSTGTLRRHRRVVVVDPKPVVQEALERSLPKLVKPPVEDKKRNTKKQE